MDYGFVHEGRTFTPNGTTGIDPAENDERNAAIDLAELERWTACPDRVVAYYRFPAEQVPVIGGRTYRPVFCPLLRASRVSADTGLPIHALQATVATWLGTTLGTVTRARVYRHNFGSRMVAIRVIGTNGAEYHGRASWDWGTAITLRRVKA